MGWHGNHFYAQNWTGSNWFLFDDAPGGTPTIYEGLRVFYGGVVVGLCLVAVSDAPTDMGGVLKIDKNGTVLAAYLVETTDPEASSVRIATSLGTKAIRLNTPFGEV